MSDAYADLPSEYVWLDEIEIPLHNLNTEIILGNEPNPEPVQLFKHGDRYIVRDGRHRILWRLFHGFSRVNAKVIYS